MGLPTMWLGGDPTSSTMTFGCDGIGDDCEYDVCVGDSL